MDTTGLVRCRIANLSVAGCEPFPALVLNNNAVAIFALQPVATSLGLKLANFRTMQGLLDEWTTNQPTLVALAEHIGRTGWDGAQLPLSKAVLHAPVSPRQVFCTIGNYRSQLAEAMSDVALANLAVDQPAPTATELAESAQQAIARRSEGEPYVCSKLPSALIGPNDPFELPAQCTQADWEVELGVVIGKPAWKVSAADALGHVAGFTVVNDITLRDRVFCTVPAGMGTDWLQSKNAPGCLPAGPFLIPATCVPDPTQLRLTLRLNGELMQDEYAGDMIFGIAEQIAYLSRHVQLLPGDLICTGSPAGFGQHYKRFL